MNIPQRSSPGPTEAMFRQLAENCEFVVWFMSLEPERILYVNPVVECIWGYPPEAFYELPRRWVDSIHPDDRARVMQAFEDWLHERRPSFAEEYRVVRPDGNVRWVLDRGTPRRDPKSSFVSGLAQDITERRKFESKLQASEARYRSTIAAMAEGIIIVNAAGDIVDCNPAAERILGASAADLLNLSVMIDWHAIHENGAPFESHDYPIVRTMRTGEPCQNEVMGVPRRDGTLRWISINTQPVIRRPDGGCEAAVISFQDITEHKQEAALLQESEMRFRQLAENIESVFWLMTWPERRMLYVSPAVQMIFGVAPEEARLRHPEAWLAAVHGDDHPLFQRCHGGIESKPPVDVEYRLVREDGVHWIRERAFPIRNAQGDVVRVAGLASCVTERRRAEENLRQREAELAQVGRASALGEMAAMLAHEINQPLYAIANFADACVHRLQSERDLDPRVLLDDAQKIAALARRAGKIVRRMQQFAKRQEPEVVELDINNVAREAVGLIEGLFTREHVRMVFAPGDKLPLIEADQLLLEQVMLNLLRNAIDAMRDTPAGNRVVHIATAREGTGVCVRVADQGPGVPAADRERIFEPFVTTKPSGLGMGLAICRSTVEAHGGQMWVEDNSPRGAIFCFRLPHAPPDFATINDEPELENGAKIDDKLTG